MLHSIATRTTIRPQWVLGTVTGTLCLLALCLLTACAASCEPAQVISEFAVNTDGDLLVVPVAIGEKEYSFVVDTGATITVFDSTLRPLLGPTRGRKLLTTPNGKRTVELFAAPEATLGSQNLKVDGLIALADLAEIRCTTGLDIDGFVGMDFLRRQVMCIDADNEKLLFLNSVGDQPGQAISITSYTNGVPVVTAEIAGWGTGSFQLDTGSCGAASVDIERRTFEYLVTGELLVVGRSTKLATIGAETRRRTGRGASLSLEGLTHGDLNFGESGRCALCAPFFTRYIATFDFPHDTLYLRKGRRFSERDRDENMSGVHIKLIDGNVVVDSVDKGSPGAESGIRPKDVLLSVDKLDATKTRLHLIYLALTGPGRTINIGVRRGQKKFNARVMLRDWGEK